MKLLRDLAEGRDSEAVAPSLRAGIPQARREQIAMHLRGLTSFVFLDGEKLTKDHFLLDTSADRVKRYKMTTGKRTIYYTFALTPNGQVARFLVEEQ